MCDPFIAHTLGASVPLLCVLDMNVINNGTQNYWLETLNKGTLYFCVLKTL